MLTLFNVLLKRWFTNSSPNLDKLPNENAQFYAKKYLGIGESVFDYSSAYLGSSEYFKRS